MDRRALRRWAVIGILALAMLGTAGAEGRYNKAAFEELMENSNKSTRVLLGALVAEDWGKAESSAETLAKNARAIRELTPKIETDRIAEFQAFADSLSAGAERLAGRSRKRDASRAASDLGRIVTVCMSCHAIFRK